MGHNVELRRSLNPAVITGLHGMMWLMPIVCSVLIVPPFERLSQDFGLELPSAAIAVIRVSHVTIRFLPVVVVVFLGFLAFDLAAQRSLQPTSARMRLWNMTMMLLPVGLVVIQALAIGYVWTTLDTKISG